MALDKMTGGVPLGPVQPADGIGKGSAGPGLSKGADSVEFKRALEQAGLQIPSSAATNPSGLNPGNALTPPSVVNGPLTVAAPGLNSQVGSTKFAPLKFSNHAIERMHSRGISFQPDEMQSIQNAISKASQKGSKDTLILSGENALIVSVKNNTVVTVMDRTAMKDNVFTNIDSTVVI